MIMVTFDNWMLFVFILLVVNLLSIQREEIDVVPIGNIYRRYIGTSGDFNKKWKPTIEEVIKVTQRDCNEANNPEVDFWSYVQPFDKYYETCATPVSCDVNSKYRTINGSCNNLENSLWGSSGTPYIRLTPASYADGNHSIRLQSDNSILPGPRELQLALFMFKAFDVDDTRNLHMCQLGQWLAHDCTLMPSDISGPADCCAIQNTENIPPLCQAVINIPLDDPVYSIINKTCLPFRRAITSTLNFNCNITPQIPINQATAFVDLSHVYGHNEDKANSLRTFVDGKLKTEIINRKKFAAQEQRNGSLFCNGRDDVSVCFEGGDPRYNQNLGLVMYGEMFVRFHNYIAILLKMLNPHWSDEILYQETRRFTSAVNQIIIFRDYIPVLLGRQYSEEFGLTLSKDVKTIYDPLLMPQMAVEFTGGCFRMAHNNIPSTYYFLDQNGETVNQVNLNEFMSFPSPIIHNNNFEEILRGISNMPGRCPMASYNQLISNFMFHKWIPGAADLDLLSVDIQRGRDIGLSSYTKVREICGFSKITSFEDLIGVLLLDDVLKLKQLYATVYDVDLIVGVLLEPIIPDAMVGETARCIIADALHRIRHSDRFFCNVQNQPGSFTCDQFDVLWELDLPKIFCAMSRIDKLPKDIFKPLGLSEQYKCKQSDIDLQAWKDDYNP